MVILGDLIRHGESHAAAIVRRNEQELSLNTIYVHLTRLHARKLVTSRDETDAEHKARTRKRRFFRITPYGEKLYKAAIKIERAAARATAGIVKPAGAF